MSAIANSWFACSRMQFFGLFCASLVCPEKERCCGPLSCYDRLALYEAAYDELLLKRQPVRIQDGDSSIEFDYSPAKLNLLRAERDKLRLECGSTPVRTRPGFINQRPGGC